MHPALVRISRRPHLDGYIAEALSRNDSLDWVPAALDRPVVAITQPEALSVRAGCRPELLNRANTMHGQRSIVGPDDFLICANQDDPISQANYDLLELTI